MGAPIGEPGFEAHAYCLTQFGVTGLANWVRQAVLGYRLIQPVSEIA